MINLFNIPDYTVDTSQFSNLLHDNIVQEFEESFAEYVGAKYACMGNSASSLLFLALLNKNAKISIPSTIPAVVPNLIINSGNSISFYDDIDWVGNSYRLHENIIDSAQEVSKNQYASLNENDAIMIFSFYPTKPIGSCDGGMVVSNSKDSIDYFRTMTLNGMSFSDVKQVRQGKYFDIEVNIEDEKKAKTKVEEMCKKLLANLVIEDYRIL